MGYNHVGICVMRTLDVDFLPVWSVFSQSLEIFKNDVEAATVLRGRVADLELIISGLSRYLDHATTRSGILGFEEQRRDSMCLRDKQ